MNKSEQFPSEAAEPSVFQEEGLALVMKGGGMKGLAYLGALRELQRFYSFDCYVGTSAGAITAALLGAGYTVDELQTILFAKTFTDFIPERFSRLTNLIFHGGLHRGTKLTDWVDSLLAEKLNSQWPVEFYQLKHRVIIYASRRDRDALVFDKKENPRISVAYAVRCSVAIPFFFIPEREQGLSVMDGGVRYNYPISKLLADNPNLRFIGLYLGDPIYTPRPKSILGELLSIIFEATDQETLKKYGDRTVVIDPKPISTLDFDLSTPEKTFLIARGRAAALRFLHKKDLVSAKESDDAALDAEEAMANVARFRKARKLKRVSIILLAVVAISTIAIWAVWPSCEIKTAPDEAMQYLGDNNKLYNVYKDFTRGIEWTILGPSCGREYWIGADPTDTNWFGRKTFYYLKDPLRRKSQMIYLEDSNGNVSRF